MDFEAEPPQDIWHTIESRLDEKDSRKAVFYWKNIAAAAAILLLLASGSFFLPEIFNPISEPALVIAPAEPANDVVPTPNNTLQSSQQQQQIQQQSSASNQPENLKLQFATATPTVKETSQEENLPTSLLSYIIPPKVGSIIHQQQHQQPATKQTYAIASIQNTSSESSNLTHTLASNDMLTPSSFALAAYFAPQQTYRYHSAGGSSLQSLETQMMNFSAGMGLKYTLNSRWEIASGLGYNRIGQNIHNIASFSHPSQTALYSDDGMRIGAHPQSMSTSMGGIIFTDQSLYFADISSTRIITQKGSYDDGIVNLLNKSGTGLVQQFEYLELPLSARYKILEKAISIYAKAGITANYLLSGNVYLQGKQHDTSIGKSVGVSKFNFAAMAGLAFSYPITHQMSVSLEPTANMFLRPMGQVQNLTKETYPYTWSVQLGVSQKL